METESPSKSLPNASMNFGDLFWAKELSEAIKEIIKKIVFIIYRLSDKISPNTQCFTLCKYSVIRQHEPKFSKVNVVDIISRFLIVSVNKKTTNYQS
jgi:hypothetical protein